MAMEGPDILASFRSAVPVENLSPGTVRWDNDSETIARKVREVENDGMRSTQIKYQLVSG
jgi:hypothetical protein